MSKFQPSVVMLTPDRQIDRRILLQADSLEAAGWHVTIIAMPLDIKTEDDRRVVRIGYNGVHAKRENLVLDTYRWIRGHLPMNGRLMRWMKRLTWRYLMDPESFYSKLFYSTASRFSPSVFVANDLPMLPVAKQMAKACGAKLVYDSHELYSEQEFSEREKQQWAEIEAKYIGSCDVVLTVNQSIANELESRYGINEVKVIYNAERLIPNLPDKKYFHDTFHLSFGTKVILFQGGLSAGRNIEALIEAMSYVQNSSLVLVILGDGLLHKTLKKKVYSGKLTSRVYFHPAVPQRDLLLLTASADAGIIPYQATCLNNYYCTPNKLFEFIAAGVPVISSNLPEIRKIIEEKKIGMVGDLSSPENIACLIDEFFDNTQRFAIWQKNVISVRNQVCWEEEEKKLIRIYEGL